MKKHITFVIITVFLGLIIIYTPSLKEKTNNTVRSSLPEEETESKPIDIKYGIRFDTMTHQEVKIKSNETFSELMQRLHFNEKAFAYFLNYKNDSIFNINKIRADSKVDILSSKKDNPEVIIIHKSETEKNILKLYPEPKASLYKIIPDTVRKIMSGYIASSLYETIAKTKTNLLLMDKISKILAWSVDFYHIYEEDKFSVVFDDLMIKDKSIGIANVHAISFKHRGKESYIFGVDEEEKKLAYYLEDGTSVVKKFLKSPVEYTRISSRYKKKRFHPILKRYKAHLGTDYAAPKGTPVKALGNGTVIESQYKKNNGNYVKIYHHKKYATQYLHLHKIKKGIKKGTRVYQGDVIGYVGQTGLATGPHLCFRFWVNGVQRDFLKYNFAFNKNKKVPQKFHKSFQENISRFRDIIDLETVTKESHDEVLIINRTVIKNSYEL